MSDNNKQLIEALLLKAAQSNGDAYRTIQDYYADVQSPMYTTNDAFRQLVDARLEGSPHLWKQSSHQEHSDVRGAESITVRTSGEIVKTVEKDGKTSWAAPLTLVEPGATLRTTPLPEGPSEPQFTDNGSSIVIKVRGEDPGSEGGK